MHACAPEKGRCPRGNEKGKRIRIWGGAACFAKARMTTPSRIALLREGEDDDTEQDQRQRARLLLDVDIAEIPRARRE